MLDAAGVLALDIFATPLAAVMEYRFRFQEADTVLCYLTGALTTNMRY